MSAAAEGVGDPRLVAEGELSLARLALDDGELPHAADHLANALAVAPTLPEAHALLAVLAGHPDGGSGLWPLDGEVYVGTAVARTRSPTSDGTPRGSAYSSRRRGTSRHRRGRTSDGWWIPNCRRRSIRTTWSGSSPS